MSAIFCDTSGHFLSPSLGFAFIEFEDPRDAEDAVRDMDGRFVCGVRIRVELAKSNSRYVSHRLLRVFRYTFDLAFLLPTGLDRGVEGTGEVTGEATGEVIEEVIEARHHHAMVVEGALPTVGKAGTH